MSFLSKTRLWNCMCQNSICWNSSLSFRGTAPRIIISPHMAMKDSKSAKKTPNQTNKHPGILILGQIEIRKLYLVSELYILELFLASASCAEDLWRIERNTQNWPWPIREGSKLLISFLRPNILFSKTPHWKALDVNFLSYFLVQVHTIHPWPVIGIPLTLLKVRSF